MNEYRSTDDQFRFVQAHHEQIEHGLIAGKRGDDTIITALVRSDEFREVSGAMSWDEAYDRYQETPGYDVTLRQRLHPDIRADRDAGRVEPPTTPKPGQSAAPADAANGLPPHLKPINATALFADETEPASEENPRS